MVRVWIISTVVALALVAPSGCDGDAPRPPQPGNAQAALLGGWTGVSPDGLDRITFTFNQDGSVHWDLKSDVHKPGTLNARFTVDETASPMQLYFHAFADPMYQGTRFLAIFENPSSDQLKLEGRFLDETLSEPAARPVVFGPDAILLTRIKP